MKKYYYGIDVGGTFIKGGIVDENNNIIAHDKIETTWVKKENGLANAIYKLITLLNKKSGLNNDDFCGIGIGLPGIVDDKKGLVKYIGCLELKNYEIKKELNSFIDLPIKIANDAEVACIAEHKLGAGEGYDSFVMFTLGTGIGCGLILNNIPYRAKHPFSCEYGHSRFLDGEFEQYASTKSLVNLTKDAMKKNKDSKMWTKYNLDNVCGLTVFDFLETDKTAKNVFNKYISYLGDGIIGVVDLLAPEIIVIGGAISAQGNNLIVPLKKYVDKHIFAKNIGYKVKIVPAKLSNDAGIIGTKFLFN